jgi:hypothetical protein
VGTFSSVYTLEAVSFRTGEDKQVKTTYSRQGGLRKRKEQISPVDINAYNI